MDWQKLLCESENTEIAGSGMLGDIEWKHYTNGLLAFSGYGVIKDFEYTETYPGYHDEDITVTMLKWDDGVPVKYIYISDGIDEIADGAFNGCSAEEVFIPESVKKIGSRAFYGNRLTSVSLPKGLTSIGSNCFAGSKNLKSLFIPENVEKFGAMELSSSIEEISVDERNRYYKTVDGILYTSDMTQLVWCPPTKSGTLYIPDLVREVKGFAFRDCMLLKNIIFSDNPISLGTLCFHNTLLQKLVLPRETVIGPSIFSCGYRRIPNSDGLIPCDAEELTVYTDKDCTALEFFRKNNIRVVTK